jgi:hypothetical protein
VDGDDPVLDLARAAGYCRCTPGVLAPFLTALVSSMMPTVPTGSAGKSVTAARTVRWTASVKPAWSHRHALRNCCRFRGAVPAWMAIGSAVFRGRSESSPRVYARKCRTVFRVSKNGSNGCKNAVNAGPSVWT